jgi:CHAD domain-containing protein
MAAARASRTHLEREAKLGAPPDFVLPDLSESGLEMAPGRRRRLETAYWDTADLRLLRWGCTLRHRKGEGWTVKLPATSQGAVLARTEHTFVAPPSAPPAQALDLVRACARAQPVQPVARMVTQRRVVRLLGRDGAALAELDDDEVTGYVGEEPGVTFRELEVELAEDAPPAVLERVMRRLRARGAKAPDPTPKLVHVLGDVARRPPDVVVDRVGRRSPAGDAVRAAIAASVRRLLAHDPGVRLGADPEDVHQARVAVRRLRSDLRTFAPLLDAGWNASLRDELRWLGGELGAVRDAEVLRDRLRATAGRLPPADAEAAGQVVGRLEDAVRETRERLLDTMGTERYVALLDRLVEAAARPSLLPAAGGAAAAVLPRLVRRPWRQLRRQARALAQEASDEDLHLLRIRAKRCRYASEAVAPVVGRRATSLARALAVLQDVLGEYHDAGVAAEWLREHGDASGEGSGVQFTAGQLWGREQVAAEQARALWWDAWRAASAKRLRSWG